MINKGLFTSATDQWATPQNFFDNINAKFKLELDVCADEINHKCDRYFTKEQDGLAQEWDANAWCNPPYGRNIGAWVKKASESKHLVVMLLPARTDTRWFHDYIYAKPNVQVIMLKGRLKFGDGSNSAPFPSMLVLFNILTEF